MASVAEPDPRHHTQKMTKALRDLKDHLRRDIEKVDEPRRKAMFETSAEVLGGLHEGVPGLRAEERRRLALGSLWVARETLLAPRVAV